MISTKLFLMRMLIFVSWCMWFLYLLVPSKLFFPRIMFYDCLAPLFSYGRAKLLIVKQFNADVSK